MTRLIIIPGYTGSGPHHWQSHWERRCPDAVRIAPQSFDEPDRDDWRAALETALEDGPAVLIGHSLGALLVAHAAGLHGIQAAFLTAPPDPQHTEFPEGADSFRPVPMTKLPFPSLVVTSSNDPYDPDGWGGKAAKAWGAVHLPLGPFGHINGDSGLGDWETGRRMFAGFLAGVSLDVPAGLLSPPPLPSGPMREAHCHCGAVTLRFPLADFSSARRCDCSFCRRRGAIAVSVPVGALEVEGAEHLTLYQWNSGVAEHYFCKICGNYTHHKRRSNPNEYGVNVAAIEGVNPRDLGEVPWADGVNHVADVTDRG